MYFYVTEKIKNHRKIGIASDLVKRYSQYQTLVPDLEFDIYIKLPSANYARIFENSFKICLAKYRMGKTECYNAPIEKIKNYLFFLTIVFDLTLLEYELTTPSVYTLRYNRGLTIEDNKGPKWGSGGLIFLNEIYFGKKVPILEVDRLTKNKLKVKVIDFRNEWKALSKFTNIQIDGLKKYYMSSNIFYNDLKNFDEKIIKCNNTPKGIKSFFEKVVKDKIYKIMNKKFNYNKHWDGAIKAQNKLKRLNPDLREIKDIVIHPTGNFRIRSRFTN